MRVLWEDNGDEKWIETCNLRFDMTKPLMVCDHSNVIDTVCKKSFHKGYQVAHENMKKDTARFMNDGMKKYQEHLQRHPQGDLYHDDGLLKTEYLKETKLPKDPLWENQEVIFGSRSYNLRYDMGKDQKERMDAASSACSHSCKPP